jgi:ABC-type transport system involved in multi-copper enzyme maturation permease subunit
MRFHWSARLLIALLVGLSFVPIFLMSYSGQGNLRAMEWNIYVRTVGTLVACVLLLAVAVRAAGSITGERQKQTLDALLTTPLELDAILAGKWVGSVLSIRWGWLWLGSILGLGVMTGGLFILAMPLLAMCWFVYACFLAALGLLYSIRCRSTVRATVATLVTTLGLWFGPGLLLACCGMLGAMGQGAEGLLKLLAGVCPPVALALMAFGGPEIQYERVGEMIGYVIVGLVIWGIATGVIWSGVRDQFRRSTERLEGAERSGDEFDEFNPPESHIPDTRRLRERRTPPT